MPPETTKGKGQRNQQRGYSSGKARMHSLHGQGTIQSKRDGRVTVADTCICGTVGSALTRGLDANTAYRVCRAAPSLTNNATTSPSGQRKRTFRQVGSHKNTNKTKRILDGHITHLRIRAIMKVALSRIQMQHGHAQAPDVEATIHCHASKLRPRDTGERKIRRADKA